MSRPSRSAVRRRVDELYAEGQDAGPPALFVHYWPSEDPEEIAGAYASAVATIQADAPAGTDVRAKAVKRAYIEGLAAGMDADRAGAGGSRR